MNRYLSKATLIALAILVLAVAWLATGTVSTNQSAAPATAGAGMPLRPTERDGAAAGRERSGISVGVRRSSASTLNQSVTLSAQTMPNRVVELRAEAEGRVVRIGAARGAAIGATELLAEIDIRDREARREQIRALLAQHELQYEAAASLGSDNLLSEVQIAEARARLISTQAELEAIELEIERTRITAPFDAVLFERHVELGDFVRIGDSVAELVDIDPMVIVGEVNEREVSGLTVGAVGRAAVGGKTVEGIVRYLAPVAQQATRTFRVELEVANPEGKLRAGTTAELLVETAAAEGHFLSPALLTLDDAGAIGVKIVAPGNVARFVPVNILSASDAGVWVDGLPREAVIIAVGQGFVTDGQAVVPVFENPDTNP